MESSGLNTEALWRFDGDGFSVIGLKSPIFARTGGKSAQSGQNGFPIRVPRIHVHLLYERPKDGIE